MKACGQIVIDLVDQDYGIAHDHAGQRNDAEQCDKPERRIKDEKRCDRADEAQGGGQKHQEQLCKASEL